MIDGPRTSNRRASRLKTRLGAWRGESQNDQFEPGTPVGVKGILRGNPLGLRLSAIGRPSGAKYFGEINAHATASSGNKPSLLVTHDTSLVLLFKTLL